MLQFYDLLLIVCVWGGGGGVCEGLRTGLLFWYRIPEECSLMVRWVGSIHLGGRTKQ